MAFEIRWTPEAYEKFEGIIAWLEQHWTEREIAGFINKSQHLLYHIARYPEMFKSSSNQDIRVANITPQINVFYKVFKAERIIVLLSFWDNRQNPEKQLY
jgi:plasmid stabilization system protein ParE